MLFLLPEAGLVPEQMSEPSGQVRTGKGKGAEPVPYAGSAPFPSMVVVFRPKIEMLEGME